MIKITLPDGSIKAYEKGITPMDVAKSISEGLARNVISAKFNEEVIETKTPLTSDGDLVLFTWDNKEGKKAFWHSSAHILAQAILFYYPNAKLTIGPAIDNGFYYDIDFEEESISENDFKKIEDKMLDFSRQKFEFSMRSVSKADALAYYHKSNNVYKVELIENLQDGDITFCDHSDFIAGCKRRHDDEAKEEKKAKIDWFRWAERGAITAALAYVVAKMKGAA